MQKISIWDFIKYSKDEYYGFSKEEKTTAITNYYVKMLEKGEFYFCFYRSLWPNLLRYLLLIQKFFQEATLILFLMF